MLLNTARKDRLVQEISSHSIRYNFSFQNAVFLYTLLGYVCKSVKISGIDHDVSGSGIHANSMKALVTDMMQESAQLYVQLSGAKGYRMSHIGGRGIMDSRPFQILRVLTKCFTPRLQKAF